MSNFFIALDISGCAFSTLSLVFDRKFNYEASITYLIVILLDIILFGHEVSFQVGDIQG